ncbi:hypothetical protein JL722_6400 [Aureococcus anophagefferens]|nr:hypothetical protein JL722_6400 [Aureococcus anophagefferens]
MAAEAKTKADGLFRDRKFTDAIDAYGEAIDLDPSNKALYSNRAACQEKLLANLFGDEKKKKVEAGLADARKCVELDASWARGHQRLAAFCDLMVKSEASQVSLSEDYVVGQRRASPTSATRRRICGGPRRRRRASRNCAKRARSRAAGASSSAASESLRLNLQALAASDYALDATLEPKDAALVDAAAAAAAKKAGSASFAAKDYKAAAAFTKALAGATDPVFYSNRSACRAALDEYRSALRDADACLTLKPGWAKAQNRRATALYGLGRYVDAEAACDAGLALEPGNAALEALKKTCALETCEPLGVQEQMHKFREEKRSNKKMQDMLKGLNLGGAGGPQIFSPSQFGSMNGMGGMGGLGGGMANMNESQMRQMARAMGGGGAGADAPPPAP